MVIVSDLASAVHAMPRFKDDVWVALDHSTFCAVKNTDGANYGVQECDIEDVTLFNGELLSIA